MVALRWHCGGMIRARTYSTAYSTCTMPIWLTAMCPQTLIVTLGDVLKSGNAKNRVNLAQSVCARCGVLHIARVVYMHAHISEVCRRACREVWIHALPFKGDDPSDSLWALQCRNPGLNIFFFDQVGLLRNGVQPAHHEPPIIRWVWTPTWSEKYIHTRFSAL